MRRRSEVFVLIHLCAKANITYFVQTIKYRSMHHARSFFIAYFNQNHHSNQSTRQRRLGVNTTSLGWKKRTKARCIDVAGNCFGEKYYKFFLWITNFDFHAHMRHDSYNYFVQTIKLRSMHHARSFFMTCFNSNPPLKSKYKATATRCGPHLARLKKGTKTRCLDVSTSCF